MLLLSLATVIDRRYRDLLSLATVTDRRYRDLLSLATVTDRRYRDLLSLATATDRRYTAAVANFGIALPLDLALLAAQHPASVTFSKFYDGGRQRRETWRMG